MSKMISLTIDGKTLQVPEGTLIVNAARQIGIDIPVFCYHPKMEPVGMCRQCLVEVGRPVIDRATGQVVMEGDEIKLNFGVKLETACTTPVSEGMVVRTSSEKVNAGQREILEFLLSSHPLDCPVCDKGGECPLQNLTMAHASPQSRFIYDEKHHAAKHVALGDKIWLDRERCIQCGRCIRFQEEVAGEPVLAFYQRGRATDIVTHSDPPFDSIFSGNTTDICPVGALTTADFRFGARPWEMNGSASICMLCPVGCNLTFNTRREAGSGGKMRIKRAMPRQNEQVNEIWICDRGRFNWHFTENDDRLLKPMLKRKNSLEAVDWKTCLENAGKLLKGGKELVVLASGRLSNEDLFQLKKLADGTGGEALLYATPAGADLTLTHGMSPGSDLGTLGKGVTIVVAGADLYHDAPIWHLRVKQAADRGAQLVIVNHQTTRLDKHATRLVRCKAGETALRVKGLEKELSASLAGSEALVIFFGSEKKPDLAEACAGLLKGRVGKPNNGMIGVWRWANTQGALEMGYQPAHDLAKKFKDRVVLIAGADPAGDDPALAKALQGAKALLVQEMMLTETARMADLVLPALPFTEREGSATSGERRVQRYYPALPPGGEAKSDHEIAALLAMEMGLTIDGGGPAQVLAHLGAEVPAFKGITYARLAEVHPQTPIIGKADLYYGGTATQNLQGLGVVLPLPAYNDSGGTEKTARQRNPKGGAG